MPAIAKKKTKMIVKDGNGDYLQLLPETEVDAELDEESSKPVACSAVAEALSGIEDAASNMGAIKVMDEEPTALNTAEYTGETLIAWVQPERWQFTVRTNGEYAATTAVPFLLDGLNASITVDWGDGTKETFTSEDAQNRHPSHRYSENDNRYYTVTIESKDFSKLYYDSHYGDFEDFYYCGSDIFALSLYSVDSPLPKLAGCYAWNEQTRTIDTLNNCLVGCFFNSPYLESVVPDVFANNPDITSVRNCFKYCNRLYDCTFHIASPLISDCSEFIRSTSLCTIYVPSGSTTQATFEAQYGLNQNFTIIGE